MPPRTTSTDTTNTTPAAGATAGNELDAVAPASSSTLSPQTAADEAIAALRRQVEEANSRANNAERAARDAEQRLEERSKQFDEQIAADGKTLNRLAADEAQALKRNLPSSLNQTTPSSTTSTLNTPSAPTRVRCRNDSKAVMWFGTDAFIVPGEVHVRNARGVAIGDTLSEAQFATRTPEQWGVLEANEQVTLSNVSDEIRAAIDAASSSETTRLLRERQAREYERAAALQRGIVGL